MPRISSILTILLVGVAEEEEEETVVEEGVTVVEEVTAVEDVGEEGVALEEEEVVMMEAIGIVRIQSLLCFFSCSQLLFCVFSVAIISILPEEWNVIDARHPDQSVSLPCVHVHCHCILYGLNLLKGL